MMPLIDAAWIVWTLASFVSSFSRHVSLMTFASARRSLRGFVNVGAGGAVSVGAADAMGAALALALAGALARGAADAVAVSDALGVAVFGCSWLLPHATTVAKK